MNDEMKYQALGKIHKMGKIGQIIADIVRVLLVLLVIVLLAAGIFIKLVPKNMISVSISEKSGVTLNGELILSLAEASIEKASGTEFEENSEGETDAEKTDAEKTDVEEVTAEYLAKTIADAVNDIKNDDAFAENYSINVNGVDMISIGAKADGGKVIIDMESAENRFDLSQLGTVFLIAAVSGILLIISVSILRNAFKRLKNCETPFEEKIIKGLNHFAVSLIPYAVFHSVEGSMEAYFLSADSKVTMQINWTPVGILLAVLILVQIFRYGAQLQKESDETL